MEVIKGFPNSANPNVIQAAAIITIVNQGLSNNVRHFVGLQTNLVIICNSSDFSHFLFFSLFSSLDILWYNLVLFFYIICHKLMVTIQIQLAPLLSTWNVRYVVQFFLMIEFNKNIIFFTYPRFEFATLHIHNALFYIILQLP